MTEQPPSAIGTVAQEAARLIEDMATMARSGYSRGEDPRPYADEPPREPAGPWVGRTPRTGADDGRANHRKADPGSADSEATDDQRAGCCSECGAEQSGTPQTCKLCPLCRGIALLRSVRPETVDLLADLALSLAASLRDVAMRSRGSDPASTGSSSGGAPDGDRAPVQDIPVDDESE